MTKRCFFKGIKLTRKEGCKSPDNNWKKNKRNIRKNNHNIDKWLSLSEPRRSSLILCSPEDRWLLISSTQMPPPSPRKRSEKNSPSNSRLILETLLFMDSTLNSVVARLLVSLSFTITNNTSSSMSLTSDSENSKFSVLSPPPEDPSRNSRERSRGKLT